MTNQQKEQWFATRLRRLETWVVLGGILEPAYDPTGKGLAPERIIAICHAELHRRGTPWERLFPLFETEAAHDRLRREPDQPQVVHLPAVTARALAQLRNAPWEPDRPYVPLPADVVRALAQLRDAPRTDP
jgi:hypothetical protein